MLVAISLNVSDQNYLSEVKNAGSDTDWKNSTKWNFAYNIIEQAL